MDGLENVEVNGAEVQETAEPATQTEQQPVNNTAEATESVETAPQTETEPTTDGKTEEDARFASVRRKAEEAARAKYEAQTAQINAEFKRLFGNYKNPETGKPIESWDEYIAAIEVQNRQQKEAELREKGIDPGFLNDLIENSPVIRQAKQVIDQNVQHEAQRQFENDLKELSKIDPAIKTAQDLFNHPSYGRVYELVSKNGLNLQDAYKLANYAELAAKSNAAVKQAAVNQAKGKTHMEATGTGIATNDNLVEVPAGMMATYKQFYPGLTEAEIKVKYNDYLKNK